MNDNMFGVIMRAKRKEMGVKQEWLAKKCDVSQQTISLYETGADQKSRETVFKIAAALDCSWLLFESPINDTYEAFDKYRENARISYDDVVKGANIPKDLMARWRLAADIPSDSQIKRICDVIKAPYYEIIHGHIPDHAALRWANLERGYDAFITLLDIIIRDNTFVEFAKSLKKDDK